MAVGISTSGGSLSYTVQIRNVGDVAFTLTNLSLTALAGLRDKLK